jgi:L-fuculose-phosphate aldolase
LHSEISLRREIIEVGKRLYQKNFVASNDGNISGKINANEILVTPTGVCKGDMTEDQLVKVNLNGDVLSGYLKPTSELKMHLAVYEERSDVEAIVHAHPQKATAFAVARIGLEKITLPEVVFTLGKIALTEYGTPSTKGVSETVKKHIKNANALLLANHGALTVGSSPLVAYFNMETLEHVAAISLYARQLGGAKELTEQQINELFRIRAEIFGKSNDTTL